MKLLKISLQNFASYDDLSLNLETGLALIYGPTGAGKSTIQDAITWCLFGLTAKGGLVDEVRNWANLDKKTIGILNFELNNQIVSIIRIRSKKPSENDLIYISNGEEFRGKDYSETQKLINSKLGFTFDEFITAAYYNEFSSTVHFFIAKSKERKQLFEQLVNLQFPETLEENLKSDRKLTDKFFKISETALSNLLAKQQQLSNFIDKIELNKKSWEEEHQTLIDNLTDKYNKEKDEQLILELSIRKAIHDLQVKQHTNLVLLNQQYSDVQLKINSLKSDTCPTCQRPHTSFEQENNEINKILKDMDYWGDDYRLFSKLNSELQTVLNSTNQTLILLNNELSKKNPYLKDVEDLKQQSFVLETQIISIKEEVGSLYRKLTAYDQLVDLTAIVRSQLLNQTIKTIEFTINHLLETYFDAELKVNLVTTDTDRLDLVIYKNTYECSYRQLSKGQRGLLKLAFGIGVMKAASNKIGVSFQNLLFDEALDGLDTNLKLKSYRLFEALNKEYPNILIIDHSEDLRQLFTKRYYVDFYANSSIIVEENE